MDWCCTCKQDGDSVVHQLLHCLVAREPWLLAFCLFGVQWVMPKRCSGSVGVLEGAVLEIFAIRD